MNCASSGVSVCLLNTRSCLRSRPSPRSAIYLGDWSLALDAGYMFVSCEFTFPTFLENHGTVSNLFLLVFLFFRRCARFAWTERKTWYSCAVMAHVSCVETECRSALCVESPWKEEFYCFNKKPRQKRFIELMENEKISNSSTTGIYSTDKHRFWNV